MSIKQQHRRGWALAGVAAVGLTIGGAALAHAVAAPDIRQVGATAIVYKGPKLDMVLSYRFAENNPNGKWLMLDTVMTAETPIGVPRSAIALRTPSGAVVPLATQREFATGYREAGWDVIRDRALMEPMGYLPPHRVRLLRFFAERGVGLAFDTAYLDEFHNSFGRLFFDLPSGVQKGRYELLINLPESPVMIPFTI
ncbi:MAG: hypothetical protein ACHQQS_07740 [Thermoanaerobaculales bacterium]